MSTEYDKQVEAEAALKEQVAQNEKEIKKEKQIKRIIKGHNDTFRKHYDLEKEYGVSFDIAIKAPNIIEQGEMRARTESYLKGTGYLAPQEVIKQYNLLSAIEVCGVDIPEILAKPEEIYNPMILSIVANDYIEWLDSFRL